MSQKTVLFAFLVKIFQKNFVENFSPRKNAKYGFFGSPCIWIETLSNKVVTIEILGMPDSS